MEEMQFLGMMRPAKKLEEIRDAENPLRFKEKVERDRREDRLEKEQAYEAAKIVMEEDIMFQE
jgi:hypothetical protein